MSWRVVRANFVWLALALAALVAHFLLRKARLRATSVWQVLYSALCLCASWFAVMETCSCSLNSIPCYALHPSRSGFACPNGTGVLNNTHRCSSPQSYCPAGSAVRTVTAVGYYAVLGVAGLYVNETICPIGSYCHSGERILCPAGTYGADPGMQNASCSGNCSAGYFCAAGSTIATQAQCSDDASYYCPQVIVAGCKHRFPVELAPSRDS